MNLSCFKMSFSPKTSISWFGCCENISLKSSVIALRPSNTLAYCLFLRLPCLFMRDGIIRLIFCFSSSSDVCFLLMNSKRLFGLVAMKFFLFSLMLWDTSPFSMSLSRMG